MRFEIILLALLYLINCNHLFRLVGIHGNVKNLHGSLRLLCVHSGAQHEITISLSIKKIVETKVTIGKIKISEVMYDYII